MPRTDVDADGAVSGTGTKNRLEDARTHPLWPEFEALVKSRQMVFSSTGERYRVWAAFLTGYERGRRVKK